MSKNDFAFLHCNSNNNLIFDLAIDIEGKVAQTDSIYSKELIGMYCVEAMTLLRTRHPDIKFFPRSEKPY